MPHDFVLLVTLLNIEMNIKVKSGTAVFRAFFSLTVQLQHENIITCSWNGSEKLRILRNLPLIKIKRSVFRLCHKFLRKTVA